MTLFWRGHYTIRKKLNRKTELKQIENQMIKLKWKNLEG